MSVLTFGQIFMTILTDETTVWYNEITLLSVFLHALIIHTIVNLLIHWNDFNHSLSDVISFRFLTNRAG